MSFKVGLRLDPHADPSFRLDPEKMLPRTRAPTLPPPAAPPPFYAENAPGPPPTQLDVHQGHRAAIIHDPDQELIRRYCRLLQPTEADALFRTFERALDNAREELKRRPPRPPLPRGWWSEPWYDLAPGAVELGFAGARDLVGWRRVLAHARRLGFDNVELRRDLELVEPLTRPFDALIHEADLLSLRIAAGIDATHLSLGDPRLSLASSLRSPAGLSRLLHALGVEATHGVRAARAHRVDRWVPGPAHEETGVHALLGLLKVFLRLLDPDEALLPELSQPGRPPGPYVGDGVMLGGAPMAAQGDLLAWSEGQEALQASLQKSRAELLHQALDRRPQLLHGAALSLGLAPPGEATPAVFLEHHLLALALLYALPGTPVVPAGIEVGAPAGALTPEWLERADLSLSPGVLLVAALNSLRATSAALHGVRWAPFGPSSGPVLGIRRGGGADQVLFLGNLGDQPERVPLGPLPLGFRLLLGREDQNGRARVWIEGGPHSSSAVIMGRAFGFFSFPG
jgi:hypothetical protein